MGTAQQGAYPDQSGWRPRQQPGARLKARSSLQDTSSQLSPSSRESGTLTRQSLTPPSYSPVPVPGDVRFSIERPEFDRDQSGWRDHTKPIANGNTSRTSPLALRNRASLSEPNHTPASSSQTPGPLRWYPAENVGPTPSPGIPLESTPRTPVRPRGPLWVMIIGIQLSGPGVEVRGVGHPIQQIAGIGEVRLQIDHPIQITVGPGGRTTREQPPTLNLIRMCQVGIVIKLWDGTIMMCLII